MKAFKMLLKYKSDSLDMVDWVLLRLSFMGVLLCITGTSDGCENNLKVGRISSVHGFKGFAHGCLTLCTRAERHCGTDFFYY